MSDSITVSLEDGAVEITWCDGRKADADARAVLEASGMSASRTVRRAAQYGALATDGVPNDSVFGAETLSKLADEWDTSKAEAARESLRRYGQELECSDEC